MAIVIDSSAILSLLIEDEESGFAEAAVRCAIAEGGLAPALFWYEVRNALIVNERRGRVSPERTQSFLDEIDALPLTLHFQPTNENVVDLARRHALTVYDAAYLELALRTNSPIATLDASLRTAAVIAGGKIFSVQQS